MRWLTGIRDRITDAKLLWASGRKEEALLLVLIAVAATARKKYPSIPVPILPDAAGLIIYPGLVVTERGRCGRCRE